jgi:hypothetical protein
MRIAHGVSLDRIQNVRAESYLEIEEILGVIEASGWRLADRRLTIADTRKFGDKRIQELLEARAARNEPPPSPPPEGDPSGFYVYEARR